MCSDRFSGVSVKKLILPVFASSLLGLAACSTTPACLKTQPYMSAQSFPPLKSPAGLDAPQPDPSMRIPDVAAGPVGYFDEIPADRDAEDPAARCLVTPPAMTSR
jgi:uncharacterized lipoprotein